MRATEDRSAITPALVEHLTRVVGAGGVLTDPTRLNAYESDALAMFREDAELVVLPKDTAEASAVMRLLHEAQVPQARALHLGREVLAA